MNQSEFVASLSFEQNAALLAFRDSINVGRDSASQELVVEHSRLIAESAAALAKQVDDAKVATDKVTAEHKTASDKLTTDLATAKADLATATDECGVLHGKVSKLEAEQPFDPSQITVSALLDRLTVKEGMALLASNDPDTKAIGVRLLTLKRANPNAVLSLDSGEIPDAINYVAVVREKITIERAKELLRPATRNETVSVTEVALLQSQLQIAEDVHARYLEMARKDREALEARIAELETELANRPLPIEGLAEAAEAIA